MRDSERHVATPWDWSDSERQPATIRDSERQPVTKGVSKSYAETSWDQKDSERNGKRETVRDSQQP